MQTARSVVVVFFVLFFLALFNLSLRLQRICGNIMPGSCFQKEISDRAQRLQTNRPHLSHNEDTWGPILHQAQSMYIRYFTDPLQFSYQPNISVDDCLIFMLQRVYAHLDNPGATVRIMFLDFSNAFNSIQPELLVRRWGDAGGAGACFLGDWLFNCQTTVCVSETVLWGTGVPQGTVLSTFLFSLYTSNFQCNSDTCFLQKYSVSCPGLHQRRLWGGIKEHNHFVGWCNNNQLNIFKTKEMVIYFRRLRPKPDPFSIQGTDVDLVSNCKYLGVQLDNTLDWSSHMEAVY